MYFFKRRWIILAGVASLLMSGCAVNKATIDSYTNPSYTAGGIKNIAIPSLRNNAAAPSQTAKVTREITKAIQQKNPELKIITAREFNDILNDNNLVRDYSHFIEDYNTTGVANKEFTRKIRGFGVDAVLIGVLNRAVQVDGAYGRNVGEARVTLNFGVVDTGSNSIIWSASADGIKGTATTVEGAPSIASAVDLAVQKIDESVPKF